jgi:hypothetical protein
MRAAEIRVTPALLREVLRLPDNTFFQNARLCSDGNIGLTIQHPDLLKEIEYPVVKPVFDKDGFVRWEQ